jgi:hypothetical protein
VRVMMTIIHLKVMMMKDIDYEDEIFIVLLSEECDIADNSC